MRVAGIAPGMLATTYTSSRMQKGRLRSARRTPGTMGFELRVMKSGRSRMRAIRFA
jgi:hypothetical protein